MAVKEFPPIREVIPENSLQARVERLEQEKLYLLGRLAQWEDWYNKERK